MLGLASAINTLFNFVIGDLGAVVPDSSVVRALLDSQAWATRSLPLAYDAALLATGLVFVMWLTRAQESTESLTGNPTRYGRFGAMAWWLVPIADWIMPYHVVREVQLSADPAARSGRGALLARTWWVVWIAASLVVISVLVDQGHNLASAWQFGILAIQWELSFLAGSLAIALIARIQDAQDRMAGLSGHPAAVRGRMGLPAVAGVAATTLSLVTVVAVSFGSIEAPPEAWSTYRPADGSFSVDLPGTPTITLFEPNGGVEREYSLSRGSVNYFVFALELHGSVSPEAVFNDVEADYASRYAIVFATSSTLDDRPARVVLMHSPVVSRSTRARHRRMRNACSTRSTRLPQEADQDQGACRSTTTDDRSHLLPRGIPIRRP